MSDDGKDQGSGASSPENDNEDTMMEEEVEGDNDSNDEEKESDNDNDNDNDDDNDDEADGDNDGDGDAEGEDADGDGDGDGSGGNQDSKGSKGAPSPAIPQLLRPRPKLQPNADICPTYDVIPYVAAPMSTSINAITATPCMRWVFTGGQDGYIRKFDWYASINGKVPLTVAQRHPFVETVVRAGVLLSYWENEEVPDKNIIPDPADEIKFSPVYSLATQSQALWLLSGLESGNINLQSVRHDEGKIIHVLRKHKSPVSVLEIIPDETAVLSGSWDKQIYDWDLHTGDISRTYADVAGQVCSISFRPQSSVPIPRDVDRLPNGVSSSHKSNLTNGMSNGVGRSPVKTEGAMDGLADAPGSPDSARSFGSLFGDDDDDIKLDDDDEFSHAIANANGRQGNGASNGMADDDVMMSEAPENTSSANVNSNSAPNENLINSSTTATATAVETSIAETNADDPMITDDVVENPNADHSTSVFLAATADGNVRIFDRRQDKAVAKITPGKGTPPWCRSACWSTDGNYIYAGRRNGTVEEFSVHKGFGEPSRTLKFPQGSGAVSVVQAMPNNRNLVCASFDNLRLYDLKETSSKPSTVPFLIIAGHHGGVVSHVLIDSTSRYMISTSGNRGWEGTTTEVLLGYEVIPMM